MPSPAGRGVLSGVCPSPPHFPPNHHHAENVPHAFSVRCPAPVCFALTLTSQHDSCGATGFAWNEGIVHTWYVTFS